MLQFLLFSLAGEKIKPLFNISFYISSQSMIFITYIFPQYLAEPTISFSLCAIDFETNILK